MKKILSFVSVALLFFATSCSDFLVEHPESSFAKEEAYTSPTLVYLNTLASVYTASAMNNTGITWGGYRANLSELPGDLLLLPGRQGDWVDGGRHQNVMLHAWTANNNTTLRTAWQTPYTQISLCNDNIASLQEMLDNGGEEFLNQYIAELRMVRAFYYYDLVNYFGRVPIVTTAGMSVSDVNQSERSQVFQFILNEIAEALPLLADVRSSDPSTEYYGRFTKPVAYMVLAKLAISAPIFSKDNWTDGSLVGGMDKVSKYVTEAGKEYMITVDGVSRNAWETVVYCQEKIASYGHTMAASAKSCFVVGNDGLPELIFVRPNNKDVYRIGQNLFWYSIHYAHGQAIGINGGNGMCASIRTCKIFGLTYDEATKTVDYSNADPRWDDFFLYGDITVNGRRIPSNVSEASYPYGSYLPFDAHIDYSVEQYNDDWGLYVVKWGGARVKKVEYCTGDVFYNAQTIRSDADQPVYRYADALLLAAEAKYRLGKEAEALELLNQVRARSGAAPRASIDYQTILDERALELVWEPTRREDMIRFGTFTEPTEDVYPGVPHTNSASDWVVDTDGHTTVYPLYTSILELNANFKQNPGY